MSAYPGYGRGRWARRGRRAPRRRRKTGPVSVRSQRRWATRSCPFICPGKRIATGAVSGNLAAGAITNRRPAGVGQRRRGGALSPPVRRGRCPHRPGGTISSPALWALWQRGGHRGGGRWIIAPTSGSAPEWGPTTRLLVGLHVGAAISRPPGRMRLGPPPHPFGLWPAATG